VPIDGACDLLGQAAGAVKDISFGTLERPKTNILDSDGRLAEKIIGAIDWQDPRILEYVRALARPKESAAR